MGRKPVVAKISRASRHTSPAKKGTTNRTETYEALYKAELIRRMRGLPPNREFLIKWTGYPESDNTWEPESNVLGLECVTDFLADQEPLEPGRKRRGSQLEPMKERPVKRKPGRPAKKGEEEEQLDEFVVEKVLAIRGEGTKKEFLVHWEGYPSSNDSWEPHSGVGHLDLVREAETLALKVEQDKFREKFLRENGLSGNGDSKSVFKAIKSSAKIVKPMPCASHASKTLPVKVSTPKTSRQPSKFECPHCNMKLKNSAGLISHVKIKHADSRSSRESRRKAAEFRPTRSNPAPPAAKAPTAAERHAAAKKLAKKLPPVFLPSKPIQPTLVDRSQRLAQRKSKHLSELEISLQRAFGKRLNEVQHLQRLRCKFLQAEYSDTAKNRAFLTINQLLESNPELWADWTMDEEEEEWWEEEWERCPCFSAANRDETLSASDSEGFEEEMAESDGSREDSVEIAGKRSFREVSMEIGGTGDFRAYSEEIEWGGRGNRAVSEEIGGMDYFRMDSVESECSEVMERILSSLE